MDPLLCESLDNSISGFTHCMTAMRLGCHELGWGNCHIILIHQCSLFHARCFSNNFPFLWHLVVYMTLDLLYNSVSEKEIAILLIQWDGIEAGT